MSGGLDSSGAVLWSGRVEKNAAGEWTVNAGSSAAELWLGIEKPYNYVCGLLAARLRKDIQTGGRDKQGAEKTPD